MSEALAFGLGLAIGLWVAANVWFYRYEAGYKAGVKMCMEAIEPVRVEIASMLGVHHVSEDMRLAMKAAAEGHEETRH
jgi:hypothetical protein